MSTTTVKTRKPDRKPVRVLSDGREAVVRARPLRPMSEAQIEKAARSDPDNPPRDVHKMRRVPHVKTLRRALGLTQEEFARRYRIPLGTVRDWEQERSQPDQPARAYLTVIAADPAGVCRALNPAPHLKKQVRAAERLYGIGWEGDLEEMRAGRRRA